MEPFEVLVEMIHSENYPENWGPPQIVKVFRHSKRRNERQEHAPTARRRCLILKDSGEGIYPPLKAKKGGQVKLTHLYSKSDGNAVR
jgi:hypothetical protein